MSQPEEFIVHIEPDGRIILDRAGLHEETYRRIIELLEETVGPVGEIELTPNDPPSRHIHPTTEKDGANSPQLELGRQDKGSS